MTLMMEDLPRRLRLVTTIQRTGQPEGVIQFGYIGKAVIGMVIVGIPALIAFHFRLEHRLTRLEFAQIKVEESQAALLRAAERAEDQRGDIRAEVSAIKTMVEEHRRRIEELEQWKDRQRELGRAVR